MSTSNGSYLVTKAAGKEGTEAGPGPAVHMDNECHLDAVSLVNEEKIIVRPESEQDSRKVAVGKVVFRNMFLDNKSLFNQGCPYPLQDVRTRPSWSRCTSSVPQLF